MKAKDYSIEPLFNDNKLSVLLIFHVIDKIRDELFNIVEHFIDNVRDIDSLSYSKQDKILEHLKKNLINKKERYISLDSLYEGLDPIEELKLKQLNINEEIIEQAQKSTQLNIYYYDNNKMLSILKKVRYEIISKYNLNANDDWNKLISFIDSISASLKCNDTPLASLVNQYNFFFEHGPNSIDKTEYLSIYNKDIYKVDILDEIFHLYNNLIEKEDKDKNYEYIKGLPIKSSKNRLR